LKSYKFSPPIQNSIFIQPFIGLEIRFVTKFGSEKMRERESCTLECTLNTDQMLERHPVLWYRDDTLLSEEHESIVNDDYRIKANGTKHSLTIYRARYERDNAVFMAKCSDSVIEANLTITEDDPVFTKPLEDKTFKLDQPESVLKVEVSSPRAEVVWKKGGLLLLTNVFWSKFWLNLF
jgi:hypothetical protein